MLDFLLVYPLVIPGRLMVGQLVLVQSIGVRISTREPRKPRDSSWGFLGSRDSNREGVGKREFPAKENSKNRGFLEARNERSRSLPRNQKT